MDRRFCQIRKGSYAQLIARGELSAILAQAEAIKENLLVPARLFLRILNI